jgi:hypothetical protein
MPYLSLAWFTLPPWSCKQQSPLQLRSASTGIHGITYKTTETLYNFLIFFYFHDNSIKLLLKNQKYLARNSERCQKGFTSLIYKQNNFGLIREHASERILAMHPNILTERNMPIGSMSVSSFLNMSKRTSSVLEGWWDVSCSRALEKKTYHASQLRYHTRNTFQTAYVFQGTIYQNNEDVSYSVQSNMATYNNIHYELSN